MKSPVTYYTDAQFEAMPVWERSLHQAASQVGVREVPKGSNWGPMVSLYLKAAGLLKPAYWCAAFVTWCIVAAGGKRSSLPKLAASTYWWMVWARNTGRNVNKPKRGYLFVWNVKGAGHIGFITSVSDSGQTFETIEGNTNSGGSREGYEVARRTRTVKEIMDRGGFFIDITSL